jgi:hypothetical protein
MRRKRERRPTWRPGLDILDDSTPEIAEPGPLDGVGPAIEPIRPPARPPFRFVARSVLAFGLRSLADWLDPRPPTIYAWPSVGKR